MKNVVEVFVVYKVYSGDEENELMSIHRTREGAVAEIEELEADDVREMQEMYARAQVVFDNAVPEHKKYYNPGSSFEKYVEIVGTCSYYVGTAPMAD